VAFWSLTVYRLEALLPIMDGQSLRAAESGETSSSFP